MGRRADRLVSHIRSITENETVNSATDISDEEILQYASEAQDRIQSKILAQHPRVFVKEDTVTAVANQEEYSLPSDCYLAGRVTCVEYTDNASASSPTYFKLKPGTERNRQSHISGIPQYYIRRDKMNDSGGSFLASPKPSGSNGQFRITYVQKMDKLDVRRAVVSAVTLATSTITSLTLDVSGDPPIDSELSDNSDYMCVVDAIGTVKMRNIRFDSINTSTGVVTINSGFSFTSGETIAVGDYVVAGQNTSTHSKLPDSIERYTIAYSALKIFKRDSSSDSQEQTSELLALEKEIIESYQEIEDDLHTVEILEDWEDFGSY